VFVEIRGDVGSRQAYLDVIDSLKSVDVDTWLAAMPPSVVKPEDRSATIDSMLSDIPVPPGLNLDQIRNDPGVLDRYQLGAAVTGAVACGWLARWDAAQASGDEQEANQAVRAMDSSRHWAILHEMTKSGAWSPVLWQFADQLDHGRLDRGNAASGLGCTQFTQQAVR
jgi:hypothetical protein